MNAQERKYWRVCYFKLSTYFFGKKIMREYPAGENFPAILEWTRTLEFSGKLSSYYLFLQLLPIFTSTSYSIKKCLKIILLFPHLHFFPGNISHTTFQVFKQCKTRLQSVKHWEKKVNRHQHEYRTNLISKWENWSIHGEARSS